MPEASWQCPDSQCGGVLERHKSERVAVDPHTDKEIEPTRTWGPFQWYGSTTLLIGRLGGMLLVFGGALLASLLFPGRASHLPPLGTIMVTSGFLAGVGVIVASEILSAKRRKAALARAVWYESYRCQRCRKWWMFPEADHPETISVDGERQTEETPAG